MEGKKERENTSQYTCSGLEPLYSRSDLDTFIRLYPRTCAIVVMERDAPLACRQDLIDLASLLFSSVIIVPEDFSEGEIPFWVRPVEIGDVLCFKVRQNLLDPKRLTLKRAVDLFLSVVGGIAISPFLVLIALAITAMSNEDAKLAMQELGKLKGSEAHSTVMLTDEDKNVLRKLGINVTMDPVYQYDRLYRK